MNRKKVTSGGKIGFCGLSLSILFHFLTLTCSAQNKQWQEITTLDGLSHGIVFGIIQTKDGYIWVSTLEGLNRYDGYNFKVYTPDPQKPFSLQQLQTEGLFEDSKGRLWTCTHDRGLHLLDRKTNKFYHCKINDANSKETTSFAGYRIIEDKNGNLWLASNRGMVFQVILPKNWKNGYPENEDFSTEIQLKSYFVSKTKEDLKHILFDRDNDLWVAGNEHLFLLKYPDYQAKEVVLDENPLKEGTEFTGFFLDKNQKIWVSRARSGLFEISKNTTQPITFRKISHAFHSAQNPKMWLNDQGVCLLKSPIDNNMWKVDCRNLEKTNPAETEPIFFTKSNSIRKFYETSDGVFFIADGISIKKFDIRAKPFRHFLSETNITKVFQDRMRRIFYNSNETTFLFDPEKNTSSQAFPEKWKTSLLQTPNGDIWAVGKAMDEKGIFLFHYNEDLHFIAKHVILTGFNEETLPLAADGENNILIATPFGNLVKFNLKTNQQKIIEFRQIMPPLNESHTGRPNVVFQDIEGTIWLGGQDGVIEIKEKKGASGPELKRHFNQPNDPESLQGNFVSSVIDDPYQPKRYLWVGVKGWGLQRLDKKTGKFRHFTTKNGFINNTVNGILQDAGKHFWISTNRGVVRFNPKTFGSRNFTREEGLQGEIFNMLAYHQAPDGTLLMSGANGLNTFKPTAIHENKEQPNVKIAGIEVNNQLIEANDETGILNENIEYLKELVLNHDQNTLKINFAIMTFSNPNRNRFRYQLEGYDNDWVETGNNHSASYVQMPAGDYTFRLFGTSEGDVWNAQPLVLRITVCSPWYRTWWAYAVYALLLSYIAYRLYLNQINRVKLKEQLAFNQKEAERLAELDQLKTNFFANISHEFRTPLTLILPPIEQLKTKNPKDEIFQIIHRNANRLLELINQLLDLSKLEAGQLKTEVQEVNLSTYFRTLTSSFNSLAESKEITFRFSQNREEIYGMIDKDKVEKIATNLISNALKFTEKGKKVEVDIVYSPEDKGIFIRVHDEGIGISKDKLEKIFNRFYQIDDSKNRRYEGTGIGLALVKELVDVLKGQIKVTSEDGIGTTFSVDFPVEYVADRLNEEVTLPAEIPMAAPPLPALTLPSVARPAPNPENILLIVDDNADIRYYIRSIFENEYQIIEAANGKEGVLKATETIPNLIISDLMMPEMDGFEFCKVLKSDEKTSHIPIIMLTAKANIESRIEGFELGADDYLIKPFNPAEIQVRVRNLVQKLEKLRAYFTGRPGEPKPTELKVSSKEEVFLVKVKEVMEKRLSESAFGAEEFAKEINMSQSQFLRKLKALTNQTINVYIREYRLQRAAELLSNKSATVSETAFKVGFESLSYFSKVFQEKYGKLPSDY